MSYSTFPRQYIDRPPKYRVVRMPAVEGAVIFEVVKDLPPTVYTVMVTRTRVTCDCMDYWKWALDDRGPMVKNYACKHIKMVWEKIVGKKK